MSAEPAHPRVCRCERPLLDDDTCLRCGRATGAEIGALVVDEPRPRRAPTWTRHGVVRALRAFAFFRGRPPVAADWSGRMGDDWPALETVERLFGSLEAAMLAAELSVRPQRG
jgi:hypothetical protein